MDIDYHVTFINNTTKGKGRILVTASNSSDKAVGSKACDFTIRSRGLAGLIEWIRK